MAFVVERATPDPGQNQFRFVFVVQVNRRFNAAERIRYLVGHAIDQFIQIEHRADALRSLLQPKQILNVFSGEGRETEGRLTCPGQCRHGVNPSIFEVTR
jgi:hypothetical protein